jgi:hypothetical protein
MIRAVTGRPADPFHAAAPDEGAETAPGASAMAGCPLRLTPTMALAVNAAINPAELRLG